MSERHAARQFSVTIPVTLADAAQTVPTLCTVKRYTYLHGLYVHWNTIYGRKCTLCCETLHIVYTEIDQTALTRKRL